MLCGKPALMSVLSHPLMDCDRSSACVAHKNGQICANSKHQ